MIIIYLKGGIGNQLFQYALGENLRNKGKVIKYDISSFKNDYRSFRLNYFNIDLALLNEKEKKIFDEFYSVKKRKINLDKKGLLFKILRKGFYIYEDMTYIYGKTVHERLFFDKRIFQINGIKILDGYWANLLYYDEIRDILLKKIELNSTYYSNEYLQYKEEIQNCINSVSIHVRRGDYLTESNKRLFTELGLDYYKRAIKHIKNNLSNVKFFVFSNDIEWCKKNFLDKNDFIYVDNDMLEDYHDFSLMNICKHNIIANSTFSWWGAYLNNNHNKIVILPKNWYSSKRLQKNFENRQNIPKSIKL